MNEGDNETQSLRNGMECFEACSTILRSPLLLGNDVIAFVFIITRIRFRNDRKVAQVGDLLTVGGTKDISLVQHERVDSVERVRIATRHMWQGETRQVMVREFISDISASSCVCHVGSLCHRCADIREEKGANKWTAQCDTLF